MRGELAEKKMFMTQREGAIGFFLYKVVGGMSTDSNG
jgi:hypothetical protein